jgi:alpha-tubulin suppressor-like RCC1 family protein
MVCWGQNGWGEIGDGTMTNRLMPTAPGIALPQLAHVATAFVHTCVVLASGGVRCWGQGVNGELGNGLGGSLYLPPTVDLALPNVTDIALGNNHTCALLTSGDVRCWGLNSYGQLGDGTLTNRLSPVVVNICPP